MHEVEIKVKGINLEEIRMKLERLNAKKVHGPVLYREFYFARANKMRKRSPNSVRIRTEGDHSLLTVKIRVPDRSFKVHRELEIPIPNLDMGRQILEALGYRSFRHREKYREEYLLNETKIEIDHYPGVPVYLEIEGRRGEIRKSLAALGYSMKDTSRETATEIIRAAGLNPDHLVFDHKSDDPSTSEGSK